MCTLLRLWFGQLFQSSTTMHQHVNKFQLNLPCMCSGHIALCHSSGWSPMAEEEAASSCSYASPSLESKCTHCTLSMRSAEPSQLWSICNSLNSCSFHFLLGHKTGCVQQVVYNIRVAEGNKSADNLHALWIVEFHPYHTSVRAKPVQLLAHLKLGRTLPSSQNECPGVK